MVKKATKEKVESVEAKATRRLVNTPSRSFEGNLTVQDVQGAQSLQDTYGKQVYSSEEQALAVLVEAISGKLADSPEEQREMNDFLEMILETDPMLREEILSHTTVRK